MLSINSSIKICLAHSKKVKIFLSNEFFYGESQKRISGLWCIYYDDSTIFLENHKEIIVASGYTFLTPSNPEESTFTIINENAENKNFKYKGCINLHEMDAKIAVLNDVAIEDCIQSLMCNYFPNNGCLEFLKLETIILRNTLIHLREKMMQMARTESEAHVAVFYSELIDKNEERTFLEYRPSELISLYKGKADHCNHTAHIAVAETKGIVALFDDEICEIPQSVCCGGIVEGDFIPQYSDRKLHLQRVCDSDSKTTIDLSQNENMEQWINNPIKCYCDDDSKEEVSALVSGAKFKEKTIFRWESQVNQKEFTALLKDHMKIDIGLITDIEVLKRGSSGAVSWLKIYGTRSVVELKGQFIVQLKEILRIQSLAFVITKNDQVSPIIFEFKGSGKGYGAGVCQMGALKQARSGKNAEEILAHYLPGVYCQKYY